jgi:hypothetical protein
MPLLLIMVCCVRVLQLNRQRFSTLGVEPFNTCRGQLRSSGAFSRYRWRLVRVGYGGESGIRTHGRVSPTHAFQACSFNHSDISPSLESTTCERPAIRVSHNAFGSDCSEMTLGFSSLPGGKNDIAEIVSDIPISRDHLRPRATLAATSRSGCRGCRTSTRGAEDCWRCRPASLAQPIRISRVSRG